MQKTIYLIGFMGSGKSHVGKKLAEALYCPFVDLDSMIEAAYGDSINAIFSEKGEKYFRLLERRVLHDTAFGPIRVVATGGGAPCFFDNMRWINQHGMAIYLDADISVLVERLWRGRAKRPLLQGLSIDQMPSFIAQKIAQRKKYYQQAAVHYRIITDKQNSAEDILENLDQITGH
jgi:shikimate kinase